MLADLERPRERLHGRIVVKVYEGGPRVGLQAEGTARTTDAEATISDAVLCAGGLRSSFKICLEMLKDEGVDTAGLGLAIGLEFGPLTATRLGLKGSGTRCSVSRGVLASEAEQSRCSGRQTAVGD